MAFVKIGEIGAVLPGGSRKFEHDGLAILVANLDGAFSAIANACPHQKGDLSLGVIHDGIVTCPKHGSRFELRTGRNVGPARILFFSVPVKDARAFPVRVEGIDLLVEIA